MSNQGPTIEEASIAIPFVDDNVPVLADEAIVVIPAPSYIIINPLTDATFEDVVLTPIAETGVAGNRKSQLTWLKEIKGNSLTKLNIKYLHIFVRKLD